MSNLEIDIRKITKYRQLDEIIANNKDKTIILRVANTKQLSKDFLNVLSNRYNNKLSIRIVGAYDDNMLKRYPTHSFLEKDNIYSLSETKNIINEIEKIEEGINPEWDDLQKTIYFIGQLKNRIIYHPLFEYVASKEIRSLTGLYTKKTVCAGYSLILKELCDRNNIECHYVMGACNEEDAKKDSTTHAWNLIRLNGNLVPIDLTWNAEKNRKGKFFSVDDLANVNKFIESHIPNSHEPIQNYKKVLKSIEGDFLRTTDYIINKDITYDSTVIRWIRPTDKSRFRLTLVGEHIIDGEYLYKYIYEKENDNGSVGKPIIFYSKTNICGVIEWHHQRKKLEKKLNSNISINEKKEIINKLEKTKVFDDIYNSLELLLSKENLIAAINRKDYYIGKIKVEDKKVKGVFIDPNFSKKIPYKQKTFRRNDGTMFVIEAYGQINIGNQTFNRYRMFEGLTIDGKRVFKKNTIFTDSNENLLTDTREDIPNYFLERKRIDRKTKETAGYLGYLDKNGIKTYIPQHNKFFNQDLYKYYRLKNEKILNYYDTISFNEMKRLIKTYKKIIINKQTIYINRYTNKQVTDKILTDHLDFSYLWLHSAGNKQYNDEIEPGYTYAFSDNAKEMFDIITSLINQNIEKDGVIDAVDILKKIVEKSKYKYAEEIITKLFAGEKNANIIGNLYKNQNPSARKKVKVINYFDQFLYYIDAYNKLNKYEEELEKEKKLWFEVKEENNKYTVEPYKGK